MTMMRSILRINLLQTLIQCCWIFIIITGIVVVGNQGNVDNDDGVIRLSSGQNVNEFIEMYIEEYDVMVFAKSYCPHCKSSKSIIEKIQQEKIGNNIWTERFINLDYMDNDGRLIQDALLQKTGQRTVPNIFINRKHIGGNSDLIALYNSGELQQTIQSIVQTKYHIQ